MMVDLFIRRPIPTTLFQITPQFASVSEGHTAVDAVVCSDDGEHLGVVVEDHEASPTRGSAIACAHPFHFHDTSAELMDASGISDRTPRTPGQFPRSLSASRRHERLPAPVRAGARAA